MNSYQMVVNTKENGKYVELGKVEVFYPLLEELGLDVKTDKKDEEGFPIYSDDKVQFVFDAVLAAVKAAARNKLQPQSATLKQGLSIASTVEELLESGGNKGDALAANREFLAAFKTFLATTGKSQAVQAAVYDLARNRAAVAMQSDDKKTKFAVYLENFAETLNAEQAARYTRPLEALNDACKAGDPLDDM